jgi:hypothetical protein
MRTRPATSGPIPKFVSTRDTFSYELRNLRTTSNFIILVPFEPEVRDRICCTVCANFGFGALGGVEDDATSRVATATERYANAE